MSSLLPYALAIVIAHTQDQQRIARILLAHQEALTGIYLEYEADSRHVRVASGIPPTLKNEISEDAERRHATFCWFAGPNFRYWEYRGDDPKNAHTVGVYRGEYWEVFGPDVQSGSRRDQSPDSYAICPEPLLSYDSKPLSYWVDASPATVIPDERFGSGSMRAELFVRPNPGERLVLYLGKEPSCVPKRYNVVIDDYLYSSFEMKEHVAIPAIQGTSRLIPSHYRATFYQYEAFGHHLVMTDVFEYDIRLIRYDASPNIVASLKAVQVPNGFLQYNVAAREMSLVGSTPECAYSAWLAGPVSSSTWFWEAARRDRADPTVHSSSGNQHFDQACGPVAMAGLLRALGREDWTFDTVSDACGSASASLNLQQMTLAGTRLGQTLLAVEMGNKPEDTPLVPFIAVLKRKSENYHYVVAVPQNDSRQSWEVRDFPYHLHHTERLEEVAGWTGMCLLPDVLAVRNWLRPDPLRKWYWGLAVAAAILIVYVAVGWRRGCRRTNPGVSR